MDEYINRQEAIKALYEVYEHDYPTASGDFDEYARHDVRNVLNGLPSADVQPMKHGKWIEKEVSRMKWIPYADDDVNPDNVDIECMTEQKCSCCKRWTIKFTYHIELDYCPLCGARMDGDSE